jgi:hypothetical protein
VSLADEAAALSSDVPSAKGPQPGQPSVEWDGIKGTLTTGTLTEEPKSWTDLIVDWGLDPDEVQVVPGSVQIRAWDANVGAGEIKRLRYYKASLERRTGPGVDAADLDELKKALLRRKPVKTKATSLSQGTRVICLADLQIGKRDGDGVEGTVDRVVEGIEGAARQAKGADRIVLAGMGDLVEGCGQHYAMQTFSVELDRREQVRIVRRLILRAIDVLAPLAPLDVISVGGNHGENRSGGKAFTTWSDNDDLAVFEQVADICNATDRYPDVRFGFPPDGDDLVVTVDCDGTGVAFAHGHQLSGGGSPSQKALRWWAGQGMGRLAAGDADILVTGHYHHLVVHEGSGRTWFQCPAMDGGSDWWQHQTGNTSPPGMLSFTVGDYGSRPWGDLTLT